MTNNPARSPRRGGCPISDHDYCPEPPSRETGSPSTSS